MTGLQIIRDLSAYPTSPVVHDLQRTVQPHGLLANHFIRRLCRMAENAVPEGLLLAEPGTNCLSRMSGDNSDFNGFTPAEILLIYNEAWCVL